MSATITDTELARDIFIEAGIPFLIMDFRVNNGVKDTKSYEGKVKDWKKLTFSQCQKRNACLIGRKQFSKIDVNLAKSRYCVVDFDLKTDIKETYAKTWSKNEEIKEEILKVRNEIGCEYAFETQSSGTGMPHIWFYKDKRDNNTTSLKLSKLGKLDLTSFKYLDIDILYQNVFENKNGFISPGVLWNDKELRETCIFKHFTIKEKKKPLSKKQKEKQKVFSAAVDFNQKFEMDDETKAIMDNINPSLFNDYKTWQHFITACFNHFGGYLEAIEYSRKNDKFKSAEDVIDQVGKKSSATFGSICWLSIKSNREKHHEIRSKYSDNWDFTDRGLTKAFLEMDDGDFVCQNEEVFVLDKKTNYWKVDKTKSLLYVTVQERLHKKYNSMKKKYANIVEDLKKNKPTFNDGELAEATDYLLEQTKTAETLESIMKLLKRIGTYTDCNCIVKQVKMNLNAESFQEVPFDLLKPKYFCFSNTAFCLSTFEQIVVEPKDYITHTTKYKWREPTKDEVKYVSDIIDKIFVDEEVKKTYLSVLFSGMIGRQFEKFIICNGSGRNGKGVINDLFAELLGSDYFYKASINGLTGKDFGNGQGASPETVAMDKRRFILWDEPEDKSTINGGKMKQLTGSSEINARGMYKSEMIPVKMLNTSALEANQKPKIDARTDNAIIERVVTVLFESSFLSKEKVEEDKTGKVFEVNPYLKTQEFKSKYKFALFYYLLNWGQKYWEDKIYVADRCAEESKRYINSNDELKNWLGLNYIVTKNKGDQVKFIDIFCDFKEYIEYDRLNTEDRKRWRRATFMESLNLTEYAIEYNKVSQGNALTYYYLKKRQNLE